VLGEFGLSDGMMGACFSAERLGVTGAKPTCPDERAGKAYGY
jgi:hypothetical protein